jgi:hypothetical protein
MIPVTIGISPNMIEKNPLFETSIEGVIQYKKPGTAAPGLLSKEERKTIALFQ